MSTPEAAMGDQPITELVVTEAIAPATGDLDGSGCCGRNTVLAIAFAVAILLLILILWQVARPRRRDRFDSADISRRLASKGWIFLAMPGCHFCKLQKDLLPNYPRVLEVSKGKIVGGYTSTPPVDISGVTGFPTWINAKTKEKKVGLQKEADLEGMAK